MLGIEVWRLKAEGVQIGILGAPLSCFIFHSTSRDDAHNHAHEARLLPTIGRYETNPSIIRRLHLLQSFRPARAQNKTQPFKFVIASLFYIKITNALSDCPPCRLLRLVNVDDLVFFIHLNLPNSLM